MSYVVPYFLSFMAASTGHYYDARAQPAPRMRHEMDVAYRTLSDCLIAAEALDRYYRTGGTWPVIASCTTDNPNLHR